MSKVLRQRFVTISPYGSTNRLTCGTAIEGKNTVVYLKEVGKGLITEWFREAGAKGFPRPNETSGRPSGKARSESENGDVPQIVAQSQITPDDVLQ